MTIICTHLKWFKTTAPSIDMKQFWLSGSLGENKNADNNDYNCGGDADNYLQVIEVKIITEKSQRVDCQTPDNYDQGVV